MTNILFRGIHSFQADILFEQTFFLVQTMFSSKHSFSLRMPIIEFLTFKYIDITRTLMLPRIIMYVYRVYTWVTYVQERSYG